MTRVARRLVGAGEIDCGRGLEQQRVGAASAVDRDFGAAVGDRVVAGTRRDGVGPAAAVDGIAAGAAGDGVGARGAGDRNPCGQRRCIDVLEIGDRGDVAGGLVDIAEIDRGRDVHLQRVGAAAAVD